MLRRDVYKAYFRMETMEHYARIALVAELLGGAKALPRQEVDKLLDARTRYGVKARNTGEPGCPVASDDPGQGGESRFYVTRADSSPWWMRRSKRVVWLDSILGEHRWVKR